MSDVGIIVAASFCAGYAVGWLLNRKPPKIEATLVVDREAMRQINLALVNAWLNDHGMTWQPKGAVYDPKKEVKK